MADSRSVAIPQRVEGRRRAVPRAAPDVPASSAAPDETLLEQLFLAAASASALMAASLVRCTRSTPHKVAMCSGSALPGPSKSLIAAGSARRSTARATRTSSARLASSRARASALQLPSSGLPSLPSSRPVTTPTTYTARSAMLSPKRFSEGRREAPSAGSRAILGNHDLCFPIGTSNEIDDGWNVPVLLVGTSVMTLRFGSVRR